jgi:UDP-GlcNAc3NAcA epimerase
MNLQKKKIITIVGARPQFIKAAPMSLAFSLFADQVTEIMIHTGQHYDENMSQIFFEEMKIPRPKYQLKSGGLSHGAMTGNMLIEIEKIYLEEKPDMVLVYGDTNSTLAGALAATKLHIPVAHIEAGLRSFNSKMPEEINRILTDHISSILFCPTDSAIANLNNEGVAKKNNVKVIKTGDIMLDAMINGRPFAKSIEAVKGLVDKPFYLATIHRSENTDDFKSLENLFSALNDISSKIPVILPLHPRTKKIISQKLPEHYLNHLKIIEPIGYFEMIFLLNHCQAVFTDSGGVQKEAYFVQKPCVTLRNETEWVELVDAGVNVLVGSDYDKIIAAEKNLNKITKFPSLLYGDGHEAKKIVSHLLSYLETQKPLMNDKK